MKIDYRDDLLLAVAQQATNENWEKWREDTEKCKVCKIYESDIQLCEEHSAWKLSNGYLDILILKVAERKKEGI